MNDVPALVDQFAADGYDAIFVLSFSLAGCGRGIMQYASERAPWRREAASSIC